MGHGGDSLVWALVLPVGQQATRCFSVLQALVRRTLWKPYVKVWRGDPKSMIKVDCAEFQHSRQIAKSIGSPPGYLGHRETPPLLTQERIDALHKAGMFLLIILFDEIEKASETTSAIVAGGTRQGYANSWP